MIDLKQLTKEKERLAKILSGEVVITPRYFGNSIIAEYSENRQIYYKRKGVPITVVDILISDLYSKPLEYLRSVGNCFNDGTYYFTNNYKSGKIVLSERDWYSPNNFPKDDTFISVDKLYEGMIDSEQMNMFKKGYTQKILEHFDATSDMTAIFIRSTENKKYAFKIDTKNQPKRYVKSDIHNLIFVDVIESIDIEFLDKMMMPMEKDSIYTAIIDNIFLRYIDNAKYDLMTTDFGYPKYMKVDDPKSKMPHLRPKIARVIDANPKLYDLYVLLLASLSKPNHESNTHITDKIGEKYGEVHSTISSLCENAMIDTSISSYFEFSNK